VDECCSLQLRPHQFSLPQPQPPTNPSAPVEGRVIDPALNAVQALIAGEGSPAPHGEVRDRHQLVGGGGGEGDGGGDFDFFVALEVPGVKFYECEVFWCEACLSQK